MRSVRRLSRPFAVLAGLWAALILVLTLTPAAEMPRTPDWELLSFDTAAHAGVFFVLVALAWLARQPAARTAGAGLGLLAAAVAFGGLIEVLQYAMHLGRHADWTDLLSDTIGAILALLLLATWQRTFADRLTALGGVLLLISTATAAQTPAPPGPDLARARRTIAALAAPGMHGRGYVRQGEHEAAAYLRGRLRALGLSPLAPDFTQPFTLDVNTFPAGLGLSLLEKLPEKRLRPGHDFIAAPESGSCYNPTEYAAQPLDTLVFSDTTTRKGYLLLAMFNNSRNNLHITHTSRVEPLAIVLRARDAARLPTLPPELQRFFAEVPLLVLHLKLTASLADSQSPQPVLHLLEECWPLNAAGQLSAQRIRLEVDAEFLRNYPTQNIAAVIRGTIQPDSFLVISAHYDHLGMMGKTAYFPGANDNASGVALLLELAAHYARPENRPAYSIAFLLFGAEEAGLVGSRYFVAHPLLPLARIKFLLNLDLLGTGEAGATVVNGRTHEAAYRRLVALNEAHHYLPALAARGRAANSDHFPFSEAGVPAFFIYTRGGSPAYHDVNDRPEALSLTGFAGAYGLLRDFTLRLMRNEDAALNEE